eukprot:gnl/MRDRNA2_/MRDRNA2_68386_c0_seq3.p2 gnl/MRDRNA2_/MRDRNA2_68386_c0~~gnl/MRDRNA2_/MRDRNA2_68386_c0_seq3.p2  ORF type:complete len:116 (-),score=28.79 gnl/MRDRNA2_/MRDRNA2_68386_c0_seq3:144-446(-)
MQAAAAMLEGEHDFAAFQSKGGRAKTVRTLHRCKIKSVWHRPLAGRTEIEGLNTSVQPLQLTRDTNRSTAWALDEIARARTEGKAEAEAEALEWKQKLQR